MDSEEGLCLHLEVTCDESGPTKVNEDKVTGDADDSEVIVEVTEKTTNMERNKVKESTVKLNQVVDSSKNKRRVQVTTLQTF